VPITDYRKSSRAGARGDAAPGVLASLRTTPRQVRWLLGCMFVNQLGAFVQVFLVLYLVHAGISASRAGLALAAYGAGSVLGALLGGTLADRLGRLSAMTGAMLCAAAATLALSVLASPQTYSALLVVVLAAGAATAASRPAAAAMLGDLVPAERLVMTVSMSRLALNCGAVIGPLLAAALMTVSWDLLFWADALTATLCALLAWRSLPRDRPAARRAPPGAPAEPSAPARDGAAATGYGALLRDGRFLLYLFAMLASAVIYMQYFAVLPLKIAADGHPELVYSAVLALSAGLVISCELLVTKHVQAWRPAIVATSGVVLLGAGLAGYGLGSGLGLLFAATLVGVLGQIVSGPTMFAHPQRVAAPAARGRYTGAAHAMFGLGTALGPVLGVLAYEALGDGVWVLCGALGALAAAATFTAIHEPARAARTTASLSTTPITGTVK
jgi:MFS family permease